MLYLINKKSKRVLSLGIIPIMKHIEIRNLYIIDTYYQNSKRINKSLSTKLCLMN